MSVTDAPPVDGVEREAESHSSTPVSEEIVQAVINDINAGTPTTGAPAPGGSSALDINSSEFRVALIEQIKVRPEIWNPRSAGAGQQREHREAAKQAWEDVCVALNADEGVAPGHTVTVDEAKRCWKQLRDSFTRCVRDEVKHGKRRRRTTWPFYSSLEFLRNVVGGTWSSASADPPTMVNSHNDNDSTTTETSAAASSSPAPAVAGPARSPDTPTQAKRPRTGDAQRQTTAGGNGVQVNENNVPVAAAAQNDLSTLLALVAACQQNQQNQMQSNNVGGLDTLLQNAILSSLGGQQAGGVGAGDAAAWLQLASLLGAVPTDALNLTQQQQPQQPQTQQLPQQQQPNQRGIAVSDDDAAFGRTVSGCLSRLSATSRELAKVRINRVLTEAAMGEQQQSQQQQQHTTDASSVSLLLQAAADPSQQLLQAAAAALANGYAQPAAANGQQQQQQQQAAALQLRQLHSLAQLQQPNGKLDVLPGF